MWAWLFTQNFPVAKNANGKRYRPVNRDGAHESRCCGKGWPKTSSNQDEQWAQRGNRQGPVGDLDRFPQRERKVRVTVLIDRGIDGDHRR